VHDHAAVSACLESARAGALQGHRAVHVEEIDRAHVDYLDWRTKSGFTDTFEAMLTRPLVVHYYDELYFGEGLAARG
jgi:hypothetical protein